VPDYFDGAFIRQMTVEQRFRQRWYQIRSQLQTTGHKVSDTKIQKAAAQLEAICCLRAV
jgi:hypothetical protein